MWLKFCDKDFLTKILWLNIFLWLRNSDTSSSDSSNSHGSNSGSSNSDSSNSDIFLVKKTWHIDNQWDVLRAAFCNSHDVFSPSTIHINKWQLAQTWYKLV